MVRIVAGGALMDCEFIKPHFWGAGRILQRYMLNKLTSGLMLLFLLAVVSAATASELSGGAITTVEELHRLAKADQSVLCAVHLEGVVLWERPDRCEIIFQDATGGLRVKIDLRSEPLLQTGQKIILEGKGLINQDGLQEALVDNDGLHSATEKSGKLWLAAGRYPIRVDWFNALVYYDLRVFLQGPELPREAVPDSVLYHEVQAENGSTNWTNGLKYTCFEGSWEKLPDFKELPIIKEGTIANFTLDVRPRDTNVGIQFTGFIDIPRAGLYTLSTESDDGSLLFIDDSFLIVKPTGKTGLPTPQRISPGQPLTQAEDCKWSTVEGDVLFISERSGALDLEIDGGAGLMFVHVAAWAKGYSALLLHSRIRATGISQSVYNSNGEQVNGGLLVPGMDQIEILEPSISAWNMYQMSAIGALLSTKSFEGSNSIVRIAGKGSRVSDQKSILVQDSSGKIIVETSQSLSGITDSPIEVLGIRTQRGTNIILESGFWRPTVSYWGNDNKSLPLLTKIEQIKSLAREDAAKGYPVRIRGVVTAPIYKSGFFIQQGTWAIYVRWDSAFRAAPPRTGDYWEVEGVTYAEFSPNVQATRAARLGSGVMPEPIRPAPDQFVNGSLDTRYIEVEGIVTAADSEGLQMLTPEGRIQVQLSEMDPAFDQSAETNFEKYENALIRLRGCAIPVRDDKTEEVQSGNYWISLCNYSIEVEQPAPPDPFSIPLKSVSELRSFNPYASILERVKVSGQILHERDNESFLWDGTNGLRFISKKPIHPQLGDFVEVVGFPDLSEPSMVLREAITRLKGQGTLPKPIQLRNDSLLNRQHDGSLVSVRARLTDISPESPGSPDEILTLQAGAHGFIARLDGQGTVTDILPGSLVKLTGVYAAQDYFSADATNSASFELLLNSPADIIVLEHPGWWTLRRLLAAFGLILLILAGAMLWIFTLRRQVSAQALMIRQKAEREATLEERARIARDIHDTLEQALAGTNLQLNALVDSLGGVSPEPLRILKVARSMINHAQDEARRTVRNLRLLSLEKCNLPTALSQYVVQSDLPSEPKIGIEVKGSYKSLPSQIESHLLRIGQEAVTNAIKHAGARNIRLELTYSDVALVLSVHDDGCGFNHTQTLSSATGHFGLLGMRERAEKIGGILEVVSAPGKGTTILVNVPLMDSNPDLPHAGHNKRKDIL